MDAEYKELRRLRVRVAVLEELLIELAHRCWQDCGTDCAQDFADKIGEARAHLKEGEGDE